MTAACPLCGVRVLAGLDAQPHPLGVLGPDGEPLLGCRRSRPAGLTPLLSVLLALELGDLAFDAEADRVGATDAAGLTDARVSNPCLVVDPDDAVGCLAVAARCHGKRVSRAYARRPMIIIGRCVGVDSGGSDYAGRLHMHNATLRGSVTHMHGGAMAAPLRPWRAAMLDVFSPQSLGFYRTPTCPIWCGLHCDPSTEHIHTTDIGGVLGDNVIVTQTEGQPPLVALIEIESPQHDMTPARARLEAYRLLMAADFAERAGLPTVTDQLIRQLAEVLTGTPGGN